jgi:hypothetical protein
MNSYLIIAANMFSLSCLNCDVHYSLLQLTVGTNILLKSFVLKGRQKLMS